MEADFRSCLDFVLEFEGGYSNDPADPGGATNFGITQGEYNVWLKNHGQSAKSVRDITKPEVETIYIEKYWMPSRAKWLEQPLDLIIFDTAVNFGVGRSTEFLAIALGLAPTMTWSAEMSNLIHAADHKFLAHKVISQRSFYRIQRVLAVTSQFKFLKGWSRRDRALFDEIS